MKYFAASEHINLQNKNVECLKVTFRRILKKITHSLLLIAAIP